MIEERISEPKIKIGNKLIVYGTILYIGSVFTYIISTFIFIRDISILGFIIDVFINIFAINLILIGGLWAKKSRDYWFLLIGLILFLGALFLSTLDVLANLVGAPPILPFQISISMVLIAILCVIAGGLMKSNKK